MIRHTLEQKEQQYIVTNTTHTQLAAPHKPIVSNLRILNLARKQIEIYSCLFAQLYHFSMSMLNNLTCLCVYKINVHPTENVNLSTRLGFLSMFG